MSEDLGLRYRIKGAARPGSASPDLLVELSGRGKERFILAIELKVSAHRAAVAQAAEQVKRAAASVGAVPVVAVPQLGSRMADWLRQQGVGYLDARGRVFIRAPGVLIDRQFGDSDVGSGWAQSASVGSPFADRSSLVLRYMLADGLAYPGVRELASELRLSPGLVSRVLRRLKDEGYVRQNEKGGGRLLSVDLLLQDWVDFYKRRARKQRDRRLYMHARDVQAIISRLGESKPPKAFPKWALSFHAGASLVARFAVFSEVHVLLGGPVWDESVEAFSRRFRLEPAAEEANLILVEPYYRESWDYGVREIRGLPVVSDVQLYLDLHLYPMRGREQAARILERILPKTVAAGRE